MTLEPLSGLVMTMSSRRFRLLMACNRALGGVGLRLAMYFKAVDLRVAQPRSFLESDRSSGSNFQYAFSKLAPIFQEGVC